MRTFLELIVIGNVAWPVLGRASRSERSGEAEQHDLLTAGEIVDLEIVGAECAAGSLDFDEFTQASGGKPVANLDRHGALLVTGAQRSNARSATAQSNGDCSGKYAAGSAAAAEQRSMLAGLVDICAKA